jgi:hemoglobin-like flavoprotein
MTPQQIRLVRDSFAKIAPSHEAVSARFYENLFRIDPTLRPLFRGDLRVQGVKLIVALATVVRALDDLGAVMETLRDLGRRHVGYGAEPRHYEAVGSALLETLQECFGPAFNAPMREAWVTFFSTVSGAMTPAAGTPAQAA